MTLSSGSIICFKSSHNSGKLWHLPVYHKGSNKNTDEQSDEEGNKARQAICAQSIMISLDVIPSWHLSTCSPTWKMPNTFFHHFYGGSIT